MMHLVKKNISFLLALSMMLSLTTPAFAQNTGKVGQGSVISVGGVQAAIIDESGSLWMRGYGIASQGGLFGNGTIEPNDANSKYYSAPVKGMDNVASVSCDHYGGAAVIKTDGSLWVWGNRMQAAYANMEGVSAAEAGRAFYPATQTKIMDNVAAVSCGSLHTAAVKNDGTLWVWGSNQYGAIGNGGAGNLAGSKSGTVWQTVPVQVLDHVVSVNCGVHITAAIKTDGSLWMWGNNWNFTKTDLIKSDVPVKVMDGVASVSLTSDDAGLGGTVAAVKTDGSLWMWGYSVPVPKTQAGFTGWVWEKSDTPVKVMDDVAAVSLGGIPGNGGYFAYIKTDGSLWSFGSIFGGPGRIVGRQDRDWPWPLFLMENVAAVSCGSAYAIAIQSDGTLWSWGVGDTYRFAPQEFQASPVKMNGLKGKVPAFTPTAPTPSKFADVSSNAYYTRPVAWAVANGITTGTSSSTFSPNATCSKGQILTFLWRALGKQEPTIQNPFSDISSGAYYYKAALWAYEAGLVSGSTFGADVPCTRAMTVTYLWKVGASSSPLLSEAPFSDVPVDADYAVAVDWAVKQKITSGTSATTFSPNATCTRGQIVTFLHRTFGY